MTSKTLLVWVHPVPDSYSAALRDAVLSAMTEPPEVIDLYRSGFDAAYLAGGRGQSQNEALLSRHKAQIADAEELLFVYPTWWDGLPAIFKSWLEQMFPDALEHSDSQQQARTVLRNIKRLTAVTTHGSSRWVNFVQGQAGRHILGKSLRSLCANGCQFRWIALYKIDRLSDSQRRNFLQKAAKKISAAA